MSKKYEKFHKFTNKQKQTISETDFTFYEILKLLTKYKISNKRILDIGCGTGTLDFFIAKKNKVTGIDISAKAISACKRDAKFLGIEKNTKFYVKNAEKDKLSGKYDIVLCLEVIEHIKQDEKLLEDIHRTLEKKGLLILSTPSKNAPLYRIGFLDKFDERVGHLRRYSLKHISKKIKDSGFTIAESIKTEGILRNLLFTSTIGSFVLKVINKLNLGPYVTALDKVSLKLFGESDLIVVARKKRDI